MKEYKIGDYVWVAVAEVRQITRPCDVCYGKKEVVLTLGNGDLVTLPCTYCGTGYEAPTGVRQDHEHVFLAERRCITEVRVLRSLTEDKVEYMSGYNVLYPNRVFDTKEEAEACSKELCTVYNQERETSAAHLKKNATKSFAWNAGYHLRCAKDNLKQAEYHQRMAKLCKDRAKDV